MYMTGAVGVAEVDEGGVDEHVLLAFLQQVLQVAEVPEATTHSIPGMEDWDENVRKWKTNRKIVKVEVIVRLGGEKLPCTVFIEDKDLPGREPTLNREESCFVVNRYKTKTLQKSNLQGKQKGR